MAAPDWAWQGVRCLHGAVVVMQLTSCTHCVALRGAADRQKVAAGCVLGCMQCHNGGLCWMHTSGVSRGMKSSPPGHSRLTVVVVAT